MAGFDDFIDLTKLNVHIYHNARVCGDWSIAVQSDGDTCFHMATQNEAMMIVPGVGDWYLQAGDLVIFPRDIAHSLEPVETMTGQQQHLSIPQSQTIQGTSLICGKVSFKHSGSELLLEALPKVFVIQRAHSTPWLSSFLTLISEESMRADNPTNAVLNRLCELLFAYALRHFVEHNQQEHGVLALFRHPKINKAIQAIHKAPQTPWQLSTLAEQATMSRTQFAQTFKSLSGWTPMHYVTWWRMQLAWSYLESGLSVALVADKVGYQSEAAFSRVFRKQFEVSAGSVRRRKTD